MTTMERKAETFVATGMDCQQAFSSLASAIQAARYAPWADGRVFKHDCALGDFSGYGEMCGELVWELTN